MKGASLEERLATQEAESAAERARADGLAADLARVREDLRTRLSPEQSKVRKEALPPPTPKPPLKRRGRPPLGSAEVSPLTPPPSP